MRTRANVDVVVVSLSTCLLGVLMLASSTTRSSSEWKRYSDAPPSSQQQQQQRDAPLSDDLLWPPKLDLDGESSGTLPDAVRTTRHVAAANGVLPGVQEVVPFLPDVPVVVHERQTWERRARMRMSKFESIEAMLQPHS